MIVQFAPAPYSFADTTKHTFTFVSTGEVTKPILSTYFGGVITNADAKPPGSLRDTFANVGKDILVWKNATGGGVVDYWQLDPGVAETALQTIVTALNADQALLVLLADGTEAP